MGVYTTEEMAKTITFLEVNHLDNDDEYFDMVAAYEYQKEMEALEHLKVSIY